MRLRRKASHQAANALPTPRYRNLHRARRAAEGAADFIGEHSDDQRLPFLGGTDIDIRVRRVRDGGTDVPTNAHLILPFDGEHDPNFAGLLERGA